MANVITAKRQVLVNLEINKSCQLTTVCGNSCILNLIEQSLNGAETMDALEVLEAAYEVIANGHKIGPLALLGKEVLESPDVLFAILQRYHETPEETRPGSVQIITSGLLLHQHLERFAELPLSGCQLSLDVEETSLHLPRRNDKLLGDLLRLKECGGAQLVGVPSILTEHNLNGLLALGKHVCASGVDQWSIGQMLSPRDGVMTPAVSLATVKQAFNSVVEKLGQSDIRQILFELELSTWQELFGESVPAGSWRAGIQVPGTNVWAFAQNASPGHFVRLRWDGQLISKEDLRRLGTREGVYGRYQPGRLRGLLESW